MYLVKHFAIGRVRSLAHGLHLLANLGVHSEELADAAAS